MKKNTNNKTLPLISRCSSFVASYWLELLRIARIRRIVLYIVVLRRMWISPDGTLAYFTYLKSRAAGNHRTIQSTSFLIQCVDKFCGMWKFYLLLIMSSSRRCSPFFFFLNTSSIGQYENRAIEDNVLQCLNYENSLIIKTLFSQWDGATPNCSSEAYRG